SHTASGRSLTRQIGAFASTRPRRRLTIGGRFASDGRDESGIADQRLRRAPAAADRPAAATVERRCGDRAGAPDPAPGVRGIRPGTAPGAGRSPRGAGRPAAHGGGSRAPDPRARAALTPLGGRMATPEPAPPPACTNQAHGRALVGMYSPRVTVETHLPGGLPGLTLVGLPETAVREARDRVRSAIQNCGFAFP